MQENLQTEVAQIQQESEELARDREKYGVAANYERILQEESERNDRNRTELQQV